MSASALDIMQAFAIEPAPLDFLWPGGPLSGTVAALTAPGGAGKSYYAIEAAMAVAAADTDGADLVGLHPASAGRVLYLALEDPATVIRHRVYAIGQHIPPDAREVIAERLTILPMVGARWDVSTAQGRDWLIEAAADMRMVVIDTLSRAHTLDENSNGDMARLLGALEYVATCTGAAIWYLHHVTKGAASSGMGADQHAARGASALTDNARWGGYLSRMTAGEAKGLHDPYTRRPIPDDQRWRYVRIGANKINYSQPQADRWLTRWEGGVLRAAELEVAPPSGNVRPIRGGKGEGGYADDDF